MRFSLLKMIWLGCLLLLSSAANAGEVYRCQFPDALKTDPYQYIGSSEGQSKTYWTGLINGPLPKNANDLWFTYIANKYYAGDKTNMREDYGSGCATDNADDEKSRREWMEANGYTPLVRENWTPASNKISKGVPKIGQQAIGRMPSKCITWVRKALHAVIQNKCDEDAEVSWCYDLPNEKYSSCTKEQFGLTSVSAHSENAIGLPDPPEANVANKFRFAACPHPATPQRPQSGLLKAVCK